MTAMRDGTPPEPLAARAARYQPLVLAEMRATIGDGDGDLFRWLRYHLGWEALGAHAPSGGTGKLLRPLAVLLATELCGGTVEAALPAAAAVELVHAFSLLHDDIEDRSATRRGRPALWALTGEPQAINAGDGMFTLARLALHRLAEAGVAPIRTLEAMREIDGACLQLVEGQFLDMSFEGRRDVSAEAYLQMVGGKTAAMFAASFAVGALLAGAPGERVSAYRAFGHHLGVAFQAVDDVLGIWGESAVTGKPTGDDLLARKMTYPVVAAIASGGDAARALHEVYGAPIQPSDLDRVQALVEAGGGRAATEALAERETAAAYAALTRNGVDARSFDLLTAYGHSLVVRVA